MEAVDRRSTIDLDLDIVCGLGGMKLSPRTPDKTGYRVPPMNWAKDLLCDLTPKGEAFLHLRVTCVRFSWGDHGVRWK
jgi:hypothetical protein